MHYEGDRQMPRKKTAEPMQLNEETWGDRVHRAYRTSRAHYGHTYREIAERMNQITSITDSTLLRLETYKEVPSQERVRRVAFYALLAYGFNPEDFGLTLENVGVAPQMAKMAADLLTPLSLCFTGTAA